MVDESPNSGNHAYKTSTETAQPRRLGIPPARIGPYKILEVLGEGGMGVVYHAQQTKPIKREVALKLVKLGMDTKQVIARFESERQALALMDHPNVAKVFDAGATEHGRPYFVMELVHGLPITAHCDRHKLTIDERLDLFMKSCEAIQHAHQKGIIHRDIKPSNILVEYQNGQATPKIIDFGVAKATSQPLTERTFFTEQGQMLGTPAYMSPEQADLSTQDIDTRCDIYSLGVLLYELLTGTLPFNAQSLRSAGFGEIQRIIRDEEPQKPSTRMSSGGSVSSDQKGASDSSILELAAKKRRSDPRALRSRIRGDLDWIVMKCLEKDRSRRYETADRLARDVRRFLNDEPVSAGPPGAGYRLRKAIRRNKGLVLAALLVLLLLVVGVSGTTVGMFRAKRAQAKSQLVATLLTDMLKTAGPEVAQGLDNTLLRKMVDQTSEGVGKKLANEPDVQATIRNTLGVTYRELGEYPAAELQLRTALDLRRQYFGDEHETVAESLHELGGVLWAKGEHNEAESLLREALAMRRKLLGSEHAKVAESMNDVAVVLLHDGDYENAEPLCREALAMRRHLLGNDDPKTLVSINNVGYLLQKTGKLAEAEPYLHEALVGNRRVLGDDHPETLASITNMGALLRDQDKLAEAERYHREALEARRRVLGDDHWQTLVSINNMGFLLQKMGKLAEAESYYREGQERHRRVLGDDHPDTLTCISNMGRLLVQVGKSTEGERLVREAVDRGRSVLGETNWLLGNFLGKHGFALTSLGRYAEAEKATLEGHGILVPRLGDEHEQTLRVVRYLVDLYERWHTTEPGKGYDAKATVWRAKLPEDTETNKP
ncbi:MAG: tetratricopeptide repeat protein [Planctomycetota bacterium]|jgi:serine/threonine protein kinase/tetratricopeptide (TPR) repeat protein